MRSTLFFLLISASGGVFAQPSERSAPPVDGVRVAVRLFLDGPFVPANGAMHDSLRVLQLVPLSEPFSALGYFHVGSGGSEQTTQQVLAVTGSDAIVDWVVLELREANSNGFRVDTRSALIQRDGDVVEMDGVSGVGFGAIADDYFLSVKHRNHLGVMTATALPFGDDLNVLDFTDALTQVYGINARKSVAGVETLWAGDATGNGQVKYSGNGNDRDPLLVLVGGTNPNGTAVGYFRQDVNMDGIVKYTGSNNDRDRILLTVGPTTPNAVRNGQVP